MSIRTWRVPPSAQIDLEDGTYPVVTQEDLAKAVVDGAIIVDRAGGCLLLAVKRVPTGVPNEYVTVEALVTWQDRTNAKAQPEPSAITATANYAPAQEITLTEQEALTDQELADHFPPPDALEPAEGPLDDGLVVDPEAVDEADPEVRAALRG